MYIARERERLYSVRETECVEREREGEGVKHARILHTEREQEGERERRERGPPRSTGSGGSAFGRCDCATAPRYTKIK